VFGWVGEQIVDERLTELMALLRPDARPNLNELRRVANAIEPLALNIKQFGYSLARQMAAALPPRERTEARRVGVPNSLSTQAAIESDWVAHWCRELAIPIVFHRQIWELCFVLQALHDRDHIRPGARGLGFGCGTELLPSYLAAQGVSLTVTDQAPERAKRSGWAASGQYALAAEQAFMPHLVDRATFDRQVEIRHVDMNAIPADLQGYDFCWSICALEHLGSIENGLRFVENSLATLRPGGLSVHTTQLNIRDDGPTIDNWPCVAFQRRHMDKLIAKLRAKGHKITPIDYSLGTGPLDRFIDLPPHPHEMPENMAAWMGPPAHLKVALDGLIVTCIGFAVEKASH